MTKASTFSAIAAAVVALFSLASCDNSPKADNSTEEKKQVPSTIKIAYVEVDSIMTQYEFCKEYSLILEKKSQNIQSTLQQKLQQNAYTREQAEQIQASLQKQNADLEALQARLSAEFQNETAKFNEALHDSLQNFINKYNKDKKYTMILSKSGDNILYANKGIDITDEIVKGLNKAYKKGSTKKEEKK